MATLPDHLRPGPVGQHRLPRDELTRHQRKRVLEAAIEVFATKGYAAATVDDLVEAAGIGVGSFYSLFKGKEGCLLAAYEEIVGEARGRLRQVDSDAPWPEQVASALEQLLAMIASQPDRARVALVEVQTAGPEAVARYEETLSEAASALAAGRAVASASKRLPASLEQGTISGVAWLLHRYLALDESQGVTELNEELVELVLEPYLGEEGARRVAQRGRLTAGA